MSWTRGILTAASLMTSSTALAHAELNTFAAVVTGWTAVAAQESASSWGFCQVTLGKGVDGRNEIFVSEVFPTEHRGAWGRSTGMSVYNYNVGRSQHCNAFVERMLEENPGRRDLTSGQYLTIFQSQADATLGLSELSAWDPQRWNYISKLRPESETGLASARKRETIFFRDPKPSLGEKGYSGNTFDIEYQFIPCMGELHLAYSVVENSVRSKSPTYLLDGAYHKVGEPDSTVLSLPISGEVWMEPYHDRIIGNFADDAAAKALGFGCFSGQTKKIANIGDLTNDVGNPATKDELPKILERLRVNFVTTTVATSVGAENEIKARIDQNAADEHERSGQAGLDRAAEDRARRKAERDADYAARQAKYEEALAAQQKAVAEYEAAKKQMEVDKAAAAEKAKATLDAYAQQRAAYEAEAQAVRDLNAKLQAEYEARARKAGIKLPKN